MSEALSKPDTATPVVLAPLGGTSLLPLRFEYTLKPASNWPRTVPEGQAAVWMFR